MTELVEPLPWDTEFFGFPIGRVTLDGADEAVFRAIETEARDLGLVCLYGNLDGNAHPTVAQTAQLQGYRLIDQVMTFDRPPKPFTFRPVDVVVREGTPDDVDRLADAIVTLEPWSRYGSDPRFSQADSLRMLRAWVERAAREPDRMMGVVEDGDDLIGVSTHWRAEGFHQIDLMGITRPSSGVAAMFLNLLFEWAGGADVAATGAGPCAARNIAVIRFLEHCGFAATSCLYRFHRWFDE